MDPLLLMYRCTDVLMSRFVKVIINSGFKRNNLTFSIWLLIIKLVIKFDFTTSDIANFRFVPVSAERSHKWRYNRQWDLRLDLYTAWYKFCIWRTFAFMPVGSKLESLWTWTSVTSLCVLTSVLASCISILALINVCSRSKHLLRIVTQVIIKIL